MLNTLAAARWALVAVLVLVLAAPALAVSLGGRLIVEVDGASMNPTYQIGDVIVVREPTEADLVVGRVVTAIDGNGDYYTHRIETVNDDGSLGLKGDGNAASDPGSVTLEQLRGVVELHFAQPWASLIIQLQQWPLRICLLAVVLGLALLPLSSVRAPERRDAPAAESIGEQMTRRGRRGGPGTRASSRRFRRAGRPVGRRAGTPAAATTAPGSAPVEVPVSAEHGDPTMSAGAPISAAAAHSDQGTRVREELRVQLDEVDDSVAVDELVRPVDSSILGESPTGYAISVIDGPDGQPRVRVTVDLDGSALAAALAVAAPSPAGHRHDVAAVPALVAAARSAVDQHVTAGITPPMRFAAGPTRPRRRHGRRRAS